ncbi:ferric reductase NAD binding domain-containing protein [Paraphysoderma sedebokerense]|nr:ferric reductase NAD binding domain-containing protein [Paraphysoderma sedebokerense]
MSQPPPIVTVALNETNIEPTRRRNVSGWQVKVKNWFVNEGSKRIFFTLFIIAHIYMFVSTYLSYKIGKKFVTVMTLVGEGIPIAKSAAACINMDCGIILFPVCRTIISKLRVTFINDLVPLDKNITFHRYVAYAIVFFTWLHVSAHYWNYLVLGKATMHSSEWYALLSGPGWTGQVATLCFFLMVTSAAEKVRRAHFEIFWYIHHLFLVFFGALLPHGAYCFVKADQGAPCAVGGNFWKYFVGGGILYTIERILREIRARQLTYLSKVVAHPGKVLELQITKPSATIRSGQYIFLNCPQVSLWQWHPFTLTSAPEESFISVHIRCVGDWTTTLANACGVTFTDADKNVSSKFGQAALQLPSVMVDGPYGAASEDWTNFEVIVCVGAGIGVTPFASILKSIFYRKNNQKSLPKLKKVYFFWVCRDKDAFSWFQDLLLAIEAQDTEDFVEIHTYLTGALKPNEITNVMIQDAEGDRDALTGLKSFTFYGRPNLDNIFSGLKVSHPETDIGVFFCGPKPLSARLHQACNKHTDSGNVGTRFYYNKENF